MMPATMKNNIIIILIFFFLIVSCQTTRDQADSLQEGESESAGAIVADVIGEGEEADTEEVEDLESEFADSEEFEKEMAEEAFPEEEAGEVAEEEADEVAEEEADEVAEEEADEVAEEEADEMAEEEADEIAEQEVVDETLDEDIGSESISDTGVVINSIRYESGENRIYVDGTGSFSYQSRKNKLSNQFIIEIPGAVLSENLRERPFVMKDFNTEMALLQADQKNSDTVRIVVQMRENASMPSVSVAESGSLVITSNGAVGGMVSDAAKEAPARRQGEDPTLSFQQGSGGAGEVLPAKSLEEFFLHTPRFTGRPISINLKDVSVRDVLYFISEGTGLNMVLADDVTGNISIKLRNVPWDQALVTVMKTKKLGYLREGNVIRIMSLEALKKDQEDIKKMMESQKILDPLKVKVIPLIYVKAEEMQTQVKELSTKDRGKVTVDRQSNSLIVTDNLRVINLIEIMVKNLDKPPMQVMIEAKIVEARERFVRDLGIKWNFRGTPLNFVPGNNSELALNAGGGIELFTGDSASGRTVAANLSSSFGPVGSLNAFLGLAEAEDLVHVISAPRVMVLNGEKAKINQQTQDIDEVTTVQQGGVAQTSPQRISADLDFEVEPQITAFGSIFMNVKMKRQFFGARIANSRPVNTREAETTVLVNNGQTIVIGGIYQQDETRSDEGFPILRHIPILKWLFSKFTSDRQRNELLLFLTPRILDFTSGNDSVEIN